MEASGHVWLFMEPRRKGRWVEHPMLKVEGNREERERGMEWPEC